MAAASAPRPGSRLIVLHLSFFVLWLVAALEYGGVLPGWLPARRCLWVLPPSSSAAALSSSSSWAKGSSSSSSCLPGGKRASFAAWAAPPPSSSSAPPRLWRRSNSVVVSSSDNERLKQVRALQQASSKRARSKKGGGLVLLEGHRLVLDALGAGHVPSSVLVSDEAMDDAPLGQQLEGVLEGLSWSTVSVVRPSSLLAAVLATVTPQGVAALIPQPQPELPSAGAVVGSEGGGVVLVLDGVQDPGNCGTLIRSAAATGARAVLCVGTGADPWGPKAMRAAMGATLRLPVTSRPSWEAVWAEGLLEGFRVLAADGGDQHPDYDQLDWTASSSRQGGQAGGPVALVVGSEGAGLSPAVRQAMAEGRVGGVRIPLAQGVESLNAAVAGSILLAEAHRQHRTKASAPSTPAPR